MRNLTPAHLRCGPLNCPSVHELEDGRLLIVGECADELAATTKISDEPSPREPWRATHLSDTMGVSEGAFVIDKALLATIRDEVREECAKIADYWAQGNWKAQSKDRSRFNIYDLQRAIENAGLGIAEDIRALKETPHE